MGGGGRGEKGGGAGGEGGSAGGGKGRRRGGGGGEEGGRRGGGRRGRGGGRGWEGGGGGRRWKEGGGGEREEGGGGGGEGGGRERGGRGGGEGEGGGGEGGGEGGEEEGGEGGGGGTEEGGGRGRGRRRGKECPTPDRRRSEVHRLPVGVAVAGRRHDRRTDRPDGRGRHPLSGTAAVRLAPRTERHAWPLHRDDGGRLVGVYLALTAVGIGVGLLLTRAFRDSAVTRTDRAVAEWFASNRTGTLNTLSAIGSSCPTR